MKLLALIFLLAYFALSSAAIVETNQICSQKVEVLKNAMVSLGKKHLSSADCNPCFDEILNAAIDCMLSFNPVQCVIDAIGLASPCGDCVCQVISDIGALLGQDWHC